MFRSMVNFKWSLTFTLLLPPKIQFIGSYHTVEYPSLFNISYRPEAGVFTVEDRAFQKAFIDATIQFIKSRFDFILVFGFYNLLKRKNKNIYRPHHFLILFESDSFFGTSQVHSIHSIHCHRSIQSIRHRSKSIQLHFFGNVIGPPFNSFTSQIHFSL